MTSRLLKTISQIWNEHATESYWPSVSVLAEFFHIGWVCDRYDAGWYGHTDTILMELINKTEYNPRVRDFSWYKSG